MARGLADFSPSALRAYRMKAYGRPTGIAMTAEELARAVGATKAQILAYENGHRVPDPPRVRALAWALKVHPWQLMNFEERNSWALADYRRGAGLRARDVVSLLGVSPKNYRRFENEGIVPSRRPRFVDEVAAALGMSLGMVERAIDQAPAVQRRQARASELVVAMAERYVPRPGPWRGPALDDPNLIELAAAYGRPVQRIRRVLTYELGELRQKQVRARRERIIADYDTDRHRQAGAQLALNRWNEIFYRNLGRMPRRLEQFHRTAQPSDVWQLLVDLYNVDATVRSDAGIWATTTLLCTDPDVLPPNMVERHTVEDIAVCRLSARGTNHVSAFAGLYAALYPGVRRPLRTVARASAKTRGPGSGPETFTLPSRAERLVVPQPLLESARMVAADTKSIIPLKLSPRFDLMVGTNSLSLVATDELFSIDAQD
ncbi:helix-turn-helix transcriptional regulator [Streptomyces sp. NBC_01750]|uniref:helix-turn-helix transcriptional regulator n=1 Tax=Streptomyces sp. NBC_01750 TaxID=2975928 RepID=UPI002DD9E75D|nr:helix-turn-helix transcriptional regulator [Streptomyces sp. NBC_01750]WSD33882.1 XRE family transcriptional regulator [Streptomyces sp. NBC_01750]